MRILLVEDDDEIVAVFRKEFEGTSLELAASRADAITALNESSYDVVVCDLRIPSTPGALDADPVHGRAVMTLLVDQFRGTPVVGFSAYGTVEIMQDLLRRARKEDVLGEGVEREMLTFFTKDQLPDCIDFLLSIRTSISTLEEVEIAAGINKQFFSWEQERAIRIYARRLNASVVHVSSLAGGLSGARVVSLRIEGAGAHLASVVAKLDVIERVAAEHQNVVTLVAPVLNSGSYPAAIILVRAGAGATGGLFYRFAGGFGESLYDAVSRGKGAPSVVRLRAMLEPWRVGAPVVSMSLADVRSILVDLDQIPAEESAHLLDEEVRFDVRRCTSHRDLHVFNILLASIEEPMVIDFGNVGISPVSLDPVTLELSTLFHPDVSRSEGSWPSREQARNWDDLEAYLVGCPDQEFVRTCRTWAFEVAAGDREVFGSVYAYAVRQFRFPDTDHDLSRALIECASRRFGQS